MAASRSAPPPPADEDSLVSLFVDTDLGTRLAMLVAADSTMRHLMSQVPVEHAAAFPDIGPVVVKAFEVLRKGEMYHLSDSMTVRTAFTKAKTECYLHAKMEAAVANTNCRRDAPTMQYRGRSNEGCLGVEVYVDKGVQKSPSSISKIASYALPQVPKVGEDAAVLKNVHTHNVVPNVVEKSKSNKKKRKRQAPPEGVVSVQEMSMPSTEALEEPSTLDQALLHKDNQELQGDGAYNVELTSRDNSGSQGTRHSQLMCDAQATTDLVADQGITHPIHKGCRDPTTDNAVNSAGVVAGEDKSAIGINAPCVGGEKRVAETSGVKKTSTRKGILEKIQLAGNTSQQKVCKKAKTVSSIDMASMDAAGEKYHCGYGENATKSDMVSTQGEIENDPFKKHILNNVQPGNSNVIENPSGERKRKKKRIQCTESSKGVDPLTKSSGFITNESSIQNTNAAPIDPKQTTSGTIRKEAVIDRKKFDEGLNVATKNVIDEVLADLRLTDNLSGALDGDLLTEQTHLGSGDKVGPSAALPPKYPAAIHSDAPIDPPSHNKGKGEQLKVLSNMPDSSYSSDGVPEENANTEIRESDSLRCSDKNKATKPQKKKIALNHVPTDRGSKQVNQIATEDSKGATTTKEVLVQGDSVIETAASTVGNVQKKSKRSSKTRTHKVQETIHCTNDEDTDIAKDDQDEYVVDIGRTHDNETAAGVPTHSPVVQEDVTTLKTSSPNVRKGRNKSSKTELQSQKNPALENGSDADLMNYRAEWGTGSPKRSADAVEQNKKINSFDHFSPSEINNTYVSAENNQDETTREVKGKRKHKQKPVMPSQCANDVEPNDLLEPHPHADKTSLTISTGNVGVPSVSAENINRDGNVKKNKEKKISKRKSDLVKSTPQQANPNGDHQDIDNGTQDFLYSVAQKGIIEQDNGKENNGNVQNNCMLPEDTEDATCDSTLEKKLCQSKFDGDNQDNLPINKDHARMSKGQSESASQTKPHAKSRNHDRFINERTDPNSKSVSNLVKSFSMSPPASSDSTKGTPQNVNQSRVAVRKVPRKRYDQTSDKSKKVSSTRGTAIFNDVISESSDDDMYTVTEKTIMEASPDDLSSSADSGISSAAHVGSDVPDVDGSVSLSQRSFKEGLHIGSILRGSSSYKKARLTQTEFDDTEVPDSQPVDSLRF